MSYLENASREKLPAAKIQKVLKNHGVETDIVNGELMANEVYCYKGVAYDKWIKVQGWSLYQVLDWLNYD